MSLLLLAGDHPPDDEASSAIRPLSLKSISSQAGQGRQEAINGGGIRKGQQQLSKQKPLLGEIRKRKRISLRLSVAVHNGGNDIWKLRPGRQLGWNSIMLQGNASWSSLGDVIWAKKRHPKTIRYSLFVSLHSSDVTHWLRINDLRNALSVLQGIPKTGHSSDTARASFHRGVQPVSRPFYLQQLAPTMSLNSLSLWWAPLNMNYLRFLPSLLGFAGEVLSFSVPLFLQVVTGMSPATVDCLFCRNDLWVLLWVFALFSPPHHWKLKSFGLNSCSMCMNNPKFLLQSCRNSLDSYFHFPFWCQRKQERYK